MSKSSRKKANNKAIRDRKNIESINKQLADLKAKNERNRPMSFEEME